ncbi:hypothetical protein Glove_367g32 [Diversispora epigaea]|uniref:Protein kinase domain-containing protein n=1 Tax=Diversispora epigaea TaxID=1348612 RepID=A0A397H723_9GLOM|nr:hypothetical protein Glove_367g32 [Diversispora epigaea]
MAKIHKLDIVHCDFHPRNILEYVSIGGEYTKATDIYSFAFVAYEIITGLLPYRNLSHDKDLTFKISTTPTNYKTHLQAIYTRRLLNFSNLPKPKDDENLKKKLEELTAQHLFIK